MSGDDDRKSELAREHKERQAQRAATEQSSNARRNTFIGAGVAVVVVAGGIFAATTLVSKDGGETASAASTPSASASTAPSSPAPTELPSTTPPKKAGSVSCTYKRDESVPHKFVGLPGKKPNLKLSTMTISTNHGDIVIDVDPNATPCSVNSMAFLAKKHFYDNTKCHRLATPETTGLFLLQCGDPQAKADGKNPTDGQGNAGYVFTDEAVGVVPYTRGVVFLTQPQDAAGQNSSQFAISLSDDNSQIEPQYSVLGMVKSGLDVIEKVAKNGVIVNDQDITGDGGSTAPKTPIVIKSVTVK
ncbi:peptidylprolyl isomerase [Nonomuraea turkmeniaca]|uniref:Peptidylprolyl isomerase n=1 Tax=Nonomuraea turkmeniaca TaxID=103838 RepID=A0A5S4FWN9_9ACTN|nr:peptidylprolyl isomerase [Nonomuraea turkmeniaca]TMR24541.1 peptidylprolyl isomerase [Nonomuraea turkmeniaca]